MPPRPLEDLSGTELQWKRAVGRITTQTLGYLSRRLLERKFDWLLPVILSRTTDPLWPDPGASIERRVEVEIYETAVRATLSMIVHKMVACSLVAPRLFVLSPNIRIERRERATTGRHTYEFTQLDFEMQRATARKVRELVDGLLSGLVKTVRRTARRELLRLGSYEQIRIPKTPFPVRDSALIRREYGDGWEEAFTERLRGPSWVTNIPREFYDYEDPSTGHWDNYDLFLPRVGEVLSGAFREVRHDRLVAKMERDGVDPKNYQRLVDLAQSGRLIPSAGAGLGLERLVTWLTGVPHVGLVQPFPRVPGTVYEL